MEYLKRYGLTDENIDKLKKTYNQGIIRFIEENEVFVINNIEYLYLENIKCIYLLMINNIKLFLETRVALENKVNKMKREGLRRKEIQVKLMQGI